MRRFTRPSVIFWLQVHIDRSRYCSNFLTLPKGPRERLHTGFLITPVAFERAEDMLLLQKVGVGVPLYKLPVVHDRVMEREGSFYPEDNILRNRTPHPFYRF